MDRSDLNEPMTTESWEDSLDPDWLGAEASGSVRHSLRRRSAEGPLVGLALVGLGFAAGFLAGFLTWGGVLMLSRARKRKA